MFPYTFEIVTALTITAIGVILVLYFLVLKRKGWLAENSNKSQYRCPNQECRKIFQKPVVLTDLSQNSPRVYSACPHCGFELEISSPSAVRRKAKMTIRTSRSQEESVARVEASKPETSIDSMETSEKPTIAKDTQKLPIAPSKTLQARPSKCSHFFGYLRNIPRNSSIPDECFSCPRMVECLAHNISE